MATDRIKYSEAIQTAAALTLNNNDIITLAQEDSQQETGYVSKATRMTTLGEKIVNGIDYTTELQTNSKKIIGAINELYQSGGSTDIIGTASGDILTFTDGGDNIPVKSLVTEIVAVQSGTGTPSPSNVRAITGFDEVEIVATGKNLFSGAVVSSDIEQDGTISSKSSAYWRSNKIPIGSNKKITFSVFSNPNYATGSFNYRAFDSSGSWVADETLFSGIGTTPTSKTVTLSANVAYLYIRGYQSGGASGITNSQIQFEFGETQSAYQPFGTTHTITLPETIYGGSAELVGGDGTKTFDCVDLGDLSWTMGSVNIGFYANLPNAISPISSGDINAICSCYERTDSPSTTTGLPNLTFCISDGNITTQKRIFIRDDSYGGDVSLFVAGVTGQKLVYTLATPTTFNTTPEQIPTLSGTNNIYSNSGDVEVEYFNENADQMAELIRVMTR